MIYCPKCGAANPDGSRVCGRCGAPIQETGIRCPACGAINPMGNVYCDRCHARLTLPASPLPEQPEEKPKPIRGISLPSRPLPGEEAEDWIARLRPTEEVPPLQAAEMEEVPPTEIPEWLLELGVVAPEATGRFPPPPPEPPREEVAPEGPALPAEPPLLLAEEMVPAQAPEEEREEAPKAPLSELPDWLAELAAAPVSPAPSGPLPFVTPEISPEAPPEKPPPDEGGPAVPPILPQWLAEVAPKEPKVPEAPQAVPPIALDWLETEVAMAPPSEVASWIPPVVLEEEPVGEEAPLAGPETAAVPDWLRQARERPETAPRPVTDFGGLVPAEIPEWLKPLRPKELGEVAEEEAEAEGFLAGLRGVLPIGRRGLDMVEAPRIRPAGPTPAAVARAELLQGLLARPLFQPPEAKRETRRETAGWAVSRLLVGLLLLAAILAPTLIRLPFFGLPAAPGADQLYGWIEGMSPETPVLVAWEYGPVEAEEMDRIAGPILVHLLRRGARVLIVSTRPEGPATAEALLQRWVPDPEVRARQVVNLGYQPGGTIGVRDLLSDLGGRTEFSTGTPAADLEAMQGVRSVADLGMVVLLAAQPDDLRAWVEQISAARPGVPLGAGISARVEPVAGAYLDAGQLRGVVSGWTGGAAYERRLDTGQGRAYEYYLTSLGLSQLVVAALMVVGAFVFLAGGRRK